MKKKNNKKKQMKQIAIDENAWRILVRVKSELRKEGRNPSLSDAIRHLDGGKI